MGNHLSLSVPSIGAQPLYDSLSPHVIHTHNKVSTFKKFHASIEYSVYAKTVREDT